MSDVLEFEVPQGCPAEYLMSLMEPRRRAWLERSLGGATLGLLYAGTSEDREQARTEIAAALAQAGNTTAAIRFGDESALNPTDPS